MNARRGFLKSLLTGGIVTAAKAAGVTPAPKAKVIVETKTVEKIVTVTEPFPQNISASEAEMWLRITEERRKERWRRLREEQDMLHGMSICPPCPDCGHQHRLSACVCGCQNKAWRS